MEDITRILVETTLRKTINEIKDSPKRSIRNLVDLGLNFTNGRFQKPFLETIQKALADEHSSYYDLVSDIVYNVEAERLITFGMNVGYNGCTQGAKKIWETESKEKYNIPWSVSLEIDGNSFVDNEKEYISVIEQGKGLGIYTWLIFAERNIEPILSLARKHSDCAFAFFCDEEYIDDTLLDETKSLYNVMFVVRYNENISGIISLLRERQMLYSVYIPYTDNNVKEITSNDCYEGIEDLHPVFTALLPSSDCSENTRRAVYDFVTDKRKKQELQTILWDVYSDSNYIDGIISDNACTVAFGKNGELFTLTEKTKMQITIFSIWSLPIFSKQFFQ